MTTRLQLYNGALLLCGETSLANLLEQREVRYALDEVWNDGGVRRCLEMAQWKFAMRAQRIDYDVNIAPEWGYRRAFAKPIDWVITSAVCYDEYFRTPILQYADEVGYWFADIDQIYVRYVSDDIAYGSDMGKWPASFAEAVKAYFAARVVARLQGAGDNRIAFVQNQAREQMLLARNKDAMAGPPTFAAQGSWSRARHGMGFSRRGPFGDGGGRSNLIG
jgi:hypothetical protein